MGGPSIFSKTPYEFVKEHKKRRLMPPRQRPAMYPPPNGFVLVQFLSRIEQIRGAPQLDFEGYFPLDNDGGLDLGHVRRTWGLETCIPIDSMRWKTFQLGADDYVSPLALHLLGQPQSRRIRVTETHVSPSTKVQRSIRCFVVDIVHALSYLYENASHKASIYIKHNTRLPLYYRAAHEKRRKLISDYNQWHNEWEREFGPGSVFLTFQLLCLLLFYLFIQSGFVEFKLRARFGEWFRTGSFMLPDKL
ncbi:hypothetical protein F5887DRAFT_988166 [Amanita rubescens]|nr:hypothetical protein F5887DRAFT_988166 [Amanita rubescens]